MANEGSRSNSKPSANLETNVCLTLLSEDRVLFQSTKYLLLTHFPVTPGVSTTKATKNILLESNAFVIAWTTAHHPSDRLHLFVKPHRVCRALEVLCCSLQHSSLQNQLWLNHSLLLAPELRICWLETWKIRVLQEWPSYAALARSTMEFYNTVMMASLHISSGHH